MSDPEAQKMLKTWSMLWKLFKMRHNCTLLISFIGHLIKAKFETNVLPVLIMCIALFETDLNLGFF